MRDTWPAAILRFLDNDHRDYTGGAEGLKT